MNGPARSFRHWAFAAVFIASCESVPPDRASDRSSIERPGGIYVESMFHRDGAPDPGYPRLMPLELNEDGTYTCFVMNGVTPGGCATFAGAGVSVGTWTEDDGTVTLIPDQPPPERAVDFDGARAEVSRDGSLTLRTKNRTHWMIKEAQQMAMIEQWEARRARAESR